MALIQNLRAALGDSANDKSDEELISLVAKSTGRNVAEVADQYRVAPSTNGQWGNRLGGSVDSYQGNLYDVGRGAAQALGMPQAAEYFDRGRRANTAQADIERSRAQRQGAVMSYKDVGGVGDAANYVGGLAVDSAPYLAEAALGGGVVGLAARGASMGVRAAGAAVASYPSAVGDVMSSQRDQSGTTDDASAAMYGVPYAALNAISPVERMAAGRSLTRNAVDLLNSGQGVRGALARGGVAAAKAGVGEGLNEVGQEMFNQAGRLSVDPNASMFDAAAMDRYGESFIGGAALGGVAGGAGGWRRSAPIKENEPTDLLNQEAPRPEFNLERYGQADGPMYNPEVPEAPAGPAEVDPAQRSLWSGVYENVSGVPTQLTSDELGSNSIPYVQPQDELFDPGTSPGAQGDPRVAEQGGLDFYTPPSDVSYGVPGEQADLFGGSSLPEETQAPGQTREPAGLSDPNQRDMFAEKPTATVQTDFSLHNVRRQLMGAPSNADTHQTIGAAKKARKPVQGKMDGWIAKLAKSLTDNLADTKKRETLLESAEHEVMSFDGSEATYVKRERALNEAKRISGLYDQRLLDAQAQEGVAQADLRGDKPTSMVSPQAAAAKATDSTSVVRAQGQQAMTELKAESDLESADNRVDAARIAQTDKVRGEIMERVLNDPATRNPLSRFYAELKRAGITDLNIRPEEVERVDRSEDAKIGLSQPDVIPSTPNELDVYGTDAEVRGGTSGAGLVAGRGGARRGGNVGAGVGRDGRATADTNVREQNAAGESVADSTDTSAVRDGRAAPTVDTKDGRSEDEQLSVTRRSFLVAAATAANTNAAKADTSLGRAKPINPNVIAQPMSAAVQKILRGNGSTNSNGALTISRALAEIAANGPVELRALAKLIDNLLPKSGVLLTVDDSRVMNAHGAVTFAPKPHLQLFTAGGRTGLNYDTFMHEALHLAVAARYRSLSNGLVRSNDSKLGQSAPSAAKSMAQFRALWDEFETAAKENPPVDEDTRLSVSEATNSPDEFFVRALTDPILQKYMAGIEYKGKSMLERFKDWVTGLFIKSGQRPSWLDAALMASSELSKEMGGDSPNFVRLGKLNDMASARSAVYSRVSDTFDLPDPKKMPAMARMWNDTLGTWRAHPGALGWYTNRQLAEKFPIAKQIAAGIGRMSARAKSLMAESHSVDMAWGRLTDAKAQELHKAMIESTMAGMHIVDPTSSTTSPEFMAVKYVDGKPVWSGDRAGELNSHVKLDENGNLAKFQRMLTQFKALDADQLKVYLDAQKKLRSDFDEHNMLFKKNVARAYERGLARYMSDPRTNPAFGGNSAEQLANLNRTKQKALTASPAWKNLSKVARRDVLAMWHDVNRQEDQTSQMRGPYFPLTRFGDHIVVLKSLKYAAAQERVEDLQKRLDVASTLDADTPEDQAQLDESLKLLREAVEKARKDVVDMRDNPNDYQVEFFEKRSEAVAREKFVRDEWIPGNAARKDMTVERILRTQYNSSLDSMSEGFVNKLEEQLTGTLPAKETAEVRAALRSIYLQQLPDRSALKSMLKRQNVAGVKTSEMRRAFASATLRNAWRLSRLEHANDIKTSIDDLRQSRDEDSRIVGDEFGKRFLTSIQQDEDKPYLDALANAGYIWHLAMSPAYLLTNLTQPWTTSVPIMANKAGGAGKAAEYLGSASMQVVKNMIASAKKDGARFEVNSTDPAFTPGERAMLKNLLNQGLIDVTLEHDLGGVAKGQEETVGGKIMRYAAWPAHQTEVVNRVATALAAYRIARNIPGTSDAEATTYAENIVASSHFDYSAENAARHMRPGSLGGLGRLVFQFKKYTQAMIYLIGSNAKKAMGGDKDAARSLAYLMGFQFAVTGMAGVPLAPLATIISKAIASAWDDDDEPQFYQMAYAGMKDAVGETAARALMKGVPAAVGVDLSGSMGQQGLLNPFAFANTQGKTGADWAAAMMFSLAGPAPALLAKGWDSAKALQEGDPMRAAQLALPRAASALVKGLDMNQRGIVDKRGNTLIDPEEVGGGPAALRALGFQYTEVGDMYDQRNAFYEAKGATTDARTRLIRELVQARSSGGDSTDVQEKIAGFNSRHPSTAIKPKDIVAALRDARNASREMRGGVRVRERDKALANDLGL